MRDQPEREPHAVVSLPGTEPPPADNGDASHPPLILVAEDDRGMAEALAYNLQREGYETKIARTGVETVSTVRAQHPDLLLLDIMLPELDGFEVCRAVRSFSTLPIIMLTAKDDEVDRVLGLELGADDYVTKPFSLRELLARVRAHLRRIQLSGRPDERVESLVYENLEIFPASRTVYRDGAIVHLLPREFDLLLYLMQNQGLVLTRDQLLQKVWGLDYLGDTRTVDVHIRRLRMKIEDDPADPQFVRTIYGVGYAFGERARRGHDSRAL